MNINQAVLFRISFFVFLTLFLVPIKSVAATYLQPAYISSIYLTNNLVNKNNSQQPDMVLNALMANNSQVPVHLVIDLVGNKGVHNLELEILDNAGRPISNTLKLNPWSASADDEYFRMTTMIGGIFPEGGIFLKISDTLNSGSRTSLGTFRVITVK